MVGMLGFAPGTAHALRGDCSQPATDGTSGPVATDCLFILRAATGTSTCEALCTCDVDDSGNIRATDALFCLTEAVLGTAPLNCDCPDLQDAAFAFAPTDCPNADTHARFTATNYIGAFPQDTPQAAGNWTDGWTISLNGNPNVWEPASGGTLGGGVPAADGACPANTTDVGDTTLPAPFAGSMDICQLAARYDTDLQVITLTNDNVYTLGGAASQGTKIGDGDAEGKSCSGGDEAVHVTLNIEPGTLILGGESEALAVTRGSQINVMGTAVDPVVMTSQDSFDDWLGGGDSDTDRGEWGGFVITGCGDANQCNNPGTCDFLLEGFLSPFFSGGDDDSDDSGTIEYLVVRQAGFDIDGNGNELNGITLFNVGFNTIISHVQVHENVDDGIEWFGGANVVDHAVITGVADDSIDSDLGFLGGLQFAVVKHAADEVDKGYEMDSHPMPGSDMRISTPCYVNVTVLGPGLDSAEGANVGTGTQAYFLNGIIKDTDEAGFEFENGTLALRDGTPADQGEDLQVHNYYLDTTVELKGNAPDTNGNAETWYDLDPNNFRTSIDGAPGINSIGYPSQTP